MSEWVITELMTHLFWNQSEEGCAIHNAVTWFTCSGTVPVCLFVSSFIGLFIHIVSFVCSHDPFVPSGISVDNCSVITHSDTPIPRYYRLPVITGTNCPHDSSSPPYNPVYVRRVDPSALDSSLSSHRHSYISLLFSSRFIT